MKVIHEPNENYVEVKDCEFKNKEAFHEFYNGLLEQYPGCTIDFVFVEVNAPEELMNEIGAEKIDSCIEMRLTAEAFTQATESEALAAENGPSYPPSGIEPVVPATFASFAEAHDRKNPDMYWTSERIKADLSRWRIYRADDDYILLGIWDTTAEIYALEAKNAAVMASLLRQACLFAFRENKTGVLWMVDEDKPEEVRMGERMGFVRTGRYSCYRK
jgi:hypothetical protein